MTLQDQSLDEFLRRVRSMPDIEAEAELLARKERSALEYNLIVFERDRLDPNGKEARRLGRELVVIGYDNHRLNSVLRNLRRKMDRLTWAKAVTALYGQEGYEACKTWMAAMDPERWRPAKEKQ